MVGVAVGVGVGEIIVGVGVNVGVGVGVNVGVGVVVMGVGVGVTVTTVTVRLRAPKAKATTPMIKIISKIVTVNKAVLLRCIRLIYSPIVSLCLRIGKSRVRTLIRLTLKIGRR
jgi:hypothetical protein